ncbi:hypothetical protein HNQ07_004711 [Deinococcus metalli]|uniref:Uncharacterized protein n=1 Tax=Deinococcus metalli TaxID=1141878 RepID=A0A7W8KJ84_9DEIO|nr:hypothetical protein [Deinococcus metalli]MBB5379196.1 hypothetical protein [Deinococcus metalli]
MNWSDREIAERTGVGNKFVGDVRRAICVSNTDTPRTVQRGGTVYTQQTSNIGKRPPLPIMPEPIWPDHDPETGEITASDLTPYLPESVPSELWRDKVLPQNAGIEYALQDGVFSFAKSVPTALGSWPTLLA